MEAKGTIYTFLSKSQPITLHFFDAHNFLDEVLNKYNLDLLESGFLKKTILLTQLLISPLRPKEGLGIYLTSPEISYRFSLETNNRGVSRIICNPQELMKLEQSSIDCTLLKKNSLQTNSELFRVNIRNIPIDTLVITILKKIFNIDSYVLTAPNSSKSLLITKLSDEPRNSPQNAIDTSSFKTFVGYYRNDLIEIINSDIEDDEEIIGHFNNLGYALSNRKIITSFIEEEEEDNEEEN